MRFRVPARFLVAVTALGLAGLALVLTPVPATRAATVDDCQASIIALRTTTATTPFLGQNAAKDQAGLLAKLDAAAAALAAGKTTDAVQKLTDFSTKVEQLSAQGKLAPADAQALTAGAAAAIACIESLSTA